MDGERFLPRVGGDGGGVAAGWGRCAGRGASGGGRNPGGLLTTLTVSPSSAATVADLRITDGNATGFSAAGIDNFGTLTLQDATVSDNTASVLGGGIRRSVAP